MEIRKNKESMMVYGRMYEGMYGGMEGHTLVVTNVEDEEEEGASWSPDDDDEDDCG